MITKAQEKLSEYAFLTLAPAAGLFIIRLFFKNLSAEEKEILAPLATATAALLILAIIWGFSKIQSRKYKPGISLQPRGIVKPEGYLLSWFRVTFFGALLFLAGSLLLSFFAGVLLGIFLPSSALEPESELFLSAAIPPLLFGQGITAYLVGRWAGVRTDKHAYLAVVAVIVIGRILLASIDSFLGYGEPIDGLAMVFFLIFTIIIGIFGSIGFWAGKKAREAGYIWYLLSNLPAESRETIESLLYEEVLRRVETQAKVNLPATNPT